MASATCSPPATISTSNRLQLSKKPFLLIEILVSILLVSLCLIPLIQGPVLGYRKEMLLLEEMEGERLAEWSFSEVKEKLLNHEIPWNKIPFANEKSQVFTLPSICIEVPGCKPKKIERHFTLRCHKKGEKEGLKGEIYRMLHIDIHFSPRLSQKKKKDGGRSDYSYRLVVQKIP